MRVEILYNKDGLGHIVEREFKDVADLEYWIARLPFIDPYMKIFVPDELLQYELVNREWICNKEVGVHKSKT